MRVCLHDVLASPTSNGSNTAERASGVLLHLTSLPGRFGVGDLGPAANELVSLLASAGQRYWQALPLVPIGPGNSPYLSPSAFAGNVLLISPDRLFDQGLIDAVSLGASELPESSRVDYGAVMETKLRLLHETASSFVSRADPDQRLRYDGFVDEQGPRWLDDFALFAALRDRTPTSWIEWPEGLARRDPEAMGRARVELGSEIETERVLQFLFFEQWEDLRRAANRSGIQIVGDLPLYVGHDSADVWAHPDLFLLDAEGRPTVVSGVPPDYFSKTGQRWGTPIYDWDHMESRGFGWWISRMRHATGLFDLVRLDHFRGVAGYWAVPGRSETAIEGSWQQGPGDKLLTAIEGDLGDLPVIAEDLGVITEDVIALRDRFDLPGMRVAQFGFDNAPDSHLHRPASFPERVWGYTGTHDNDTTLGWFWAGNPKRRRLRLNRRRRRLYRATGGKVVSGLVEMVSASKARTCIFPIQDILELGSEARMNTPGTEKGNWAWRLRTGQLDDEAISRLAEVTRVNGR
jgi:4-alpha-glucanotransferase